jgi:hypothetical protein
MGIFHRGGHGCESFTEQSLVICVELVEAALLGICGLCNVDQFTWEVSAFVLRSSDIGLNVLRGLSTQSLQGISLSSNLFWVDLGTASVVGIESAILVGLVRVAEEVLAIRRLYYTRNYQYFSTSCRNRY